MGSDIKLISRQKKLKSRDQKHHGFRDSKVVIKSFMGRNKESPSEAAKTRDKKLNNRGKELKGAR